MAETTRNKHGQPQDPKQAQQKKPQGQDVETSERGRVGQSQDRNKLGQQQGGKPGQQGGNKQDEDELADLGTGVTDDEIDRDVDADLDEDERITQRMAKQRAEDKPV